MSALAVEPQKYLDSLAKPANSLGVLEEWAATLCKVQRTLKPRVDSMSILVFCADHGIKKDDFEISPYPQSVTQAVFRALAAGVSGTATVLGCRQLICVVQVQGICGITESDVRLCTRETTLPPAPARVVLC